LRFGRFEVQPHERRLLLDGELVALGARAFDLLLALLEHPGQLLSKRVLMDRVWPDVIVEENNLAAQMSALRKVLGTDVVATVPGRGYRFIGRLDLAANVTTGHNAPPPPAPEQSAPSVPAPRTNLPTELPLLLGRAEDLDLLGAQIGLHRLLTIVGAGGIGKTLLAQHLLAGRRRAYRHGVCWVELAAVTDPAGLPGAILAALGVKGGSGDPLAALVAGVAPLQLLLALDNAEHLLDGVAQVCQALHGSAPELSVVVTSQAPLGLGAERVHRVAALAVPEGPLPAHAALQFGAVALFHERALAADSRFSLTDANAATVIELCRRLDGLPLAIELAAARAPMLGVQGLLGSLGDRFQVLGRSRDRQAPARQQTLRAALDWSHSFLDLREQVVYRRLGVMAGSASLKLILQVVADDEAEDPAAAVALDRWAVLDALGVLVDRSLVAVLPSANENAGEAPRYRLLESARADALQRLAAAGELETLRRRHALALAEHFDRAWRERFDGSVGYDDWKLGLSFDFDNARDAMAWAGTALESRTELVIGATLLRALPESPRAERRALVQRCEDLLRQDLPAALRQRTWFEISIEWGATQPRRCLDAAVLALDLARTLQAQTPDVLLLYLSLCRLALAAAIVGDAASASAALQELNGLEVPDWPAHCRCWGVEARGQVAFVRGDVAEALRQGRRLVALDRARGALATHTLANLLDVELASGDAAAAAASGTALAAALEGSRDLYGLNLARLNLCAAWLALGDLPQARPVARAGWAGALQFDMHPFWADYLALLAALEQRSQAAARLLGYADARYLACGATRQPNEAAAVDRARSMAMAALAEPAFERLHAEGALMPDSEVDAEAFPA
jgi:predicted ATPase/DNA-binding winged helix-turn-helix (wHTH) protein